MKHIVSFSALFIITYFIAVVNSYTSYSDVQQQSVVKDTTTISNSWNFRGDFHLGVSSYVVEAVNIPKYTHLYGTGTVQALNFVGSASGLTGFPIVSTASYSLNSGLWKTLDIDTSTLVAGDLFTWNGSSVVRVASGTVAGQYLKQDLTWGTPAGAGDMVEANINTYTAIVNTSTAQSIAGAKTFSDFNTSDDSIYKLIYSTSGITTSSITIAGLDGNVDKEYYIVFAGTGSATDSMKLFYNSDITTTNYAYGNCYFSTSYKYDGGNSADWFNYAESGFYAQTWIRASTGVYRLSNTLNSATTSATTMQSLNMMSHQWENTTSNITSMTFYTNAGTPTIYITDLSIYTRR